MNKFSIVAMGPGNLDYTTPAAMNKIKQADTLMGASRLMETVCLHLAATVDAPAKKYIPVDANLGDLKTYIESCGQNECIAVLVTGDSGFYSLLGYLSRSFSKEQFDVVPGISSLQYMFSAIKEQWAGSPLMSLHGRDCPYVAAIGEHRFVGLLTDKKNTPLVVATTLVTAGLGDVLMHVGSNLSYDDELIWCQTAETVAAKQSHLKHSDLCVIILENKIMEV